jgi:hypothetical protein
MGLHSGPLLLLAASVVWWLACWPLVPKITGSIPAEAIRFFVRKNHSMPLSHDADMRHVKEPCDLCGTGQIDRPFLARNSVLHVSHVA